MNPNALHQEERSQDFDIVKAYLEDIGQFDLLTKEDEYRLWEQIQPGLKARQVLGVTNSETFDDEKMEELTTAFDEETLKQLLEDFDQYKLAREQFINANLRLVVSIAKRYTGKLSLLDCIQEGNIGLEHAVDKFDARKGFKFSTYASWWIRQAITRGIADTGTTIDFPVHFSEKAMLVEKHRAMGLSPMEIEEITDIKPADQERIVQTMRNLGNLASLDAPLGEEDSTTLYGLVDERVASKEYGQIDDEEIASDIREMLREAGLTDQEVTIIELRYGIGGGERQTLETIGDMFGITRERIRQIQQRAQMKLRNNQDFRSYFNGLYGESAN